LATCLGAVSFLACAATCFAGDVSAPSEEWTNNLLKLLSAFFLCAGIYAFVKPKPAISDVISSKIEALTKAIAENYAPAEHVHENLASQEHVNNISRKADRVRDELKAEIKSAFEYATAIRIECQQQNTQLRAETSAAIEGIRSLVGNISTAAAEMSGAFQQHTGDGHGHGRNNRGGTHA
jgi:hypothetical protein